MRPRSLALAGGAGCLLALVAFLAAPAAALGGWLIAFLLWSSLPLGALFLVLLTRLVPGPWRREIAAPAETALLLLPPALVASLPVLAGVHLLYDWADEAQHGGFRALYLTTWFFSLRSLVFLVGACGLGFLLLRRPRSVALAAPGLIAFVLLDTLFAVDWLMSLTPDFHAAVFGLYGLSLQMTVALPLLLLLSLAGGRAEPVNRILGSLLLVCLLLWGYFAFVQYFIVWSGNAPGETAWYQQRAGGFWTFALYLMGLLRLGPAFLLFFSLPRRSAAWLRPLAGCVLLGSVVEVCWLVLPALHGTHAVTLLVTAVALLGLGLLSAAVLTAAPQLGRGLHLFSTRRHPQSP